MGISVDDLPRPNSAAGLELEKALRETHEM